jgi:hypothetical protein
MTESGARRCFFYGLDDEASAQELDQQTPGILWRAEVLVNSVVLQPYRIERETRRGYWLVEQEPVFGQPVRTWRFRGGRFASKTKREALSWLLSRKASYVRHSERRLRDAKLQYSLVQGLVAKLAAKEP